MIKKSCLLFTNIQEITSHSIEIEPFTKLCAQYEEHTLRIRKFLCLTIFGAQQFFLSIQAFFLIIVLFWKRGNLFNLPGSYSKIQNILTNTDINIFLWFCFLQFHWICDELIQFNAIFETNKIRVTLCTVWANVLWTKGKLHLRQVWVLVLEIAR